MPGWGGGEVWSGVRIHLIHPAPEKGKGFSPSSWPRRCQPEPQQTPGMVLEQLRAGSALGLSSAFPFPLHVILWQQKRKKKQQKTAH